jgi:Na+-transporting NADH:ubiquinone oxidoreductase subunit NqrF
MNHLGKIDCDNRLITNALLNYKWHLDGEKVCTEYSWRKKLTFIYKLLCFNQKMQKKKCIWGVFYFCLFEWNLNDMLCIQRICESKGHNSVKIIIGEKKDYFSVSHLLQG